ncbi:MAG: 3-deoxy-7-phosphoheptulonate synthase [Lachnospiraceae bacterium]|nr:3-deoxy-7-phosphoheptulonate synthase [Lachnospiraceae bacterium]
MSFDFIRKLPMPMEIKEIYPMPASSVKIKEENDKNIRAIFTGESDRFLLIIGPCSADREDSVCDYLLRLRKVQEEVKDKILIVPRIYTNKPRTTGEGYKGMLHQPDPEKKEDMLAGIISIRKLHLRAIAETGFTAADEMLYCENYRYLSDILSYVAVGARSVENQLHRLTASGMDIPVGMKNPTSGALSVMLNSIKAAHMSHTFLYRGWEVVTTGNPLAHAILRGSVSKHGQTIPNYHFEDLQLLYELYQERHFPYPAVIVDTNHSNSGKKYKEQIRIANEVLHSRRHSEDLRHFVKGLMIESYIEEGCQKIGEGTHVYGKSITDPCLGWEDTRALILSIAEQL